MNQKINYLINIALVICLVAISITGLTLFFAFTSGAPGVGRTVTFLGTHKKDWLPWHRNFGLAMIALMFLHFILHFNWLKDMTINLFKKELS